MSNIGYFKEKGTEVQTDFKNMFVSLGDAMAREFKALTPKLEASWVGVDQQNYTFQLANRLQALYIRTGTLIENANALIAASVNGWIDFQNANVLAGTQAAVTDTDYIPAIKLQDAMHEMIQYNPQKKLTEQARTVEGPEILVSALQAFVEGLTTEINGLASKVETSSKEVLRGQVQEAAMGEYVAAMKKGIINVVTAIDDMKQAIYTLAGTNYEQSAQEAATKVNTDATELGQATESISGKWTMS